MWLCLARDVVTLLAEVTVRRRDTHSIATARVMKSCLLVAIAVCKQSYCQYKFFFFH